MKKGNLQNSQRFAKDAYQKIGADSIAALEIGNEPNNYGKSKPDYVNQWKSWSTQILDTLGLDANTSILQAVCLGSETGGKTLFPGGTPGDWKVWVGNDHRRSDYIADYARRDLFEINQGLKTVRSRIKTVSMH